MLIIFYIWGNRFCSKAGKKSSVFEVIISLTFLSLCVHVCGWGMWLCTCSTMYVSECVLMYVHLKARSQRQVSFLKLLALLFETGHLTEPGAHHSARLASQWTAEISQSPHWDFRRALWCLDVLLHTEDQNLPPHTCVLVPYQWSHSPRANYL